jgi:hypothetical protein
MQLADDCAQVPAANGLAALADLVTTHGHWDLCPSLPNTKVPDSDMLVMIVKPRFIALRNRGAGR